MTSVRSRRVTAVWLCVLAAACSRAPERRDLAAATPIFSAQGFFAGRTRGDGVLQIVTQGAQTVVVYSVGRIAAGGVLILDQTVDRAGVRSSREWRLKETSPGRYVGTLTDAAGPVVGDATGNGLHLRFAMKGGGTAEQRLYLSPDGRSARNLMTVRRWGVPVATLDERIAKVE